MQLQGRQKPGAPMWIDHMAPDHTTAWDFYGGLLGWKIHDSGPDLGHYGMANVGGTAVAGLGPNPPGSDAPARWCVFFEVDDVPTALRSAADLGGRVLQDVMSVPGMGHMAVLEDPTGATVGVWRSDPFPGFGAYGEPGFPGWVELATTDVAAAKEFYGRLFGWAFTPMPGGMEYVTAELEGLDSPVAGIGAAPPDAGEAVTSSFWQPYLQVDGTDGAVARVREAGGSVLGEPFDTPFGRMAFVADPQGARFALFTPPGPGEAGEG